MVLTTILNSLFHMANGSPTIRPSKSGYVRNSCSMRCL
nr:MAG TPA: hypothetical protein [Caudoviricetes sp.]